MLLHLFEVLHFVAQALRMPNASEAARSCLRVQLSG